MKKLFIILSVISTSVYAQDLVHIRSQYARAVETEKAAHSLLTYLSKEKQVPIIKGFVGATTVVLAKHLFFPHQKIKSFSNGKKILEEAIAADPQNTELIFLRYAIQRNAPSFLGYTNNLKTDVAFLYRQVVSGKISDKSLKKKVVELLLDEETINSEQKKNLVNS